MYKPSQSELGIGTHCNVHAEEEEDSTCHGDERAIQGAKWRGFDTNRIGDKACAIAIAKGKPASRYLVAETESLEKVLRSTKNLGWKGAYCMTIGIP
jgi:hypothetical protein